MFINSFLQFDPKFVIKSFWSFEYLLFMFMVVVTLIVVILTFGIGCFTVRWRRICIFPKSLNFLFMKYTTFYIVLQFLYTFYNLLFEDFVGLNSLSSVPSAHLTLFFFFSGTRTNLTVAGVWTWTLEPVDWSFCWRDIETTNQQWTNIKQLTTTCLQNCTLYLEDCLFEIVSRLNSFTTYASASGLTPLSIKPIKMDKDSLSSPVFNKFDISCTTINIRSHIFELDTFKSLFGFCKMFIHLCNIWRQLSTNDVRDMSLVRWVAQLLLYSLGTSKVSNQHYRCFGTTVTFRKLCSPQCNQTMSMTNWSI